MRTDQLREPVAELLDHPGTQRPITKTTSAQQLELSSSHAVPGTEVVLDGTLESSGDAVVLTGTVTFEWEGACRRCLDPVRGTAEAGVREVFSRLGDDDSFPLDDGEIDLAPVLREAVLLNLPLAPLCRTDCRGPAPDSYPAEPTEEHEGSDERRDPRWAVLDELGFGESRD